MAIDLTFSVASGSARAKVDAVHVHATGLDTQLNYYLRFTHSGDDPLKSQVFGPDHNAEWQWDDLIFPSAGTWACAVHLASDDSNLDSENYVVV